jgi:ferredoxin--NADP+ reductase
MTLPASVNSITKPDIPSNIHSLKNPGTATLIENRRLTGEASPNDVRHLVLDLSGTDLHYVAGQSLGILPPGETPEGKPHKLRLYSIASPACGDDGAGKTATLCVKRSLWPLDDGTMFRGVCSNYLSDLPVGSTLTITGPVGKAFVLPDDPKANFIFLATGTGIAPFRGFLKTLYQAPQTWQGTAHLFFGAQYTSDYLYETELSELAAKAPDTFSLVTAFSREETTPDGQRCYIQHKVAQQGPAMAALVQQPSTYVYICGLKGMEHGIIEAFATACTAQGVDWTSQFEAMKAQKRWHVEVY